MMVNFFAHTYWPKLNTYALKLHGYQFLQSVLLVIIKFSKSSFLAALLILSLTSPTP